MNAKVKFSGNIINDILEARGIDQFDFILLDSDTLEYRPEKAEQLVDAINSKKTIFYTDVDADGMSAAGVVKCYFPNALIIFGGDRFDSRGLSEDVAEELWAFFSPELVVTLDTGITAIDGIKRLQEYGCEVFVTDHHLPQEELPNCNIINPHLEDFSFQDLCGAGVIYAALSSVLGENKQALQYAAIGTICDVVPILYDNRYIVKTGLELLHSVYREEKIVDLANTLGVTLNNEKSIAWYLGPAINAASRMGTPKVAFDAYVDGNIAAANELKELNKRRKRETKTFAKTAQIVANDDIVVAVIEGQKNAIAGLTAGHMANAEQKPVAVCVKNRGIYTCSIRTLGIINAVDFIESCEYVDGGGHAAAAGFTVRQKNFDNFVKELSKFVQENGVEIEPDIPDIEIAASVAIDLYDAILSLSPYGQDFKEPLFMEKDVVIVPDMLSFTTSGHLRVEFDGFKGYYYHPPQDISFEGRFDITYSLSYNVWQKEIFIIIEDMKKND